LESVNNSVRTTVFFTEFLIMSTQLIGLKTGEVLIGDVTVNENGETLGVDKPCSVQIQPMQNPNNPQGPPVAGIAMVPYTPFAESQLFEFRLCDLLWGPKPAQQEIANDYRIRFGSGIAAVSAGELPATPAPGQPASGQLIT
jgi:hypothetical protein